MELERRIYCIEGHWDYGKKEVEPSVEPILQMLQKHGMWNYARRDCATQEELQFWLKHEWKRCKPGSILYIASHGSAGCITLAYQNDVDILQLADWMSECGSDCKNKLIHFGGCNILAGKKGDEAVRGFMCRTEASCVTGYSKTPEWIYMKHPAAALELILFAEAADIEFGDGRSAKRPMHRIENNFNDNKIFEGCGFRVLTKWD